MRHPHHDLIDHLASHFALSEHDAERVIDEVCAWLNEPVDDYVRRRHGELQRTGLKNPQIFRQVLEELESRPFATGIRSERQLRRLIYG